MEQGLVHVYHGQGKGKTTAAIGLCMRALGRSKSVLFVQFLKGWESGELITFAKLDNIEVLRGKPTIKFSFQMSEKEKDECLQAHNLLLRKAIDIVGNKKIDLLVLDEVIGTCNNELLDKNMLLDFLRQRPENLEVVMTGRNPDVELLDIADYVSEINKIKHPMDRGIRARIGIER